MKNVKTKLLCLAIIFILIVGFSKLERESSIDPKKNISEKFNIEPDTTDSFVETKWIKGYDGPGHGLDQAVDIAVDRFENVYVTGFSSSSGSPEDYITIKYNPDGTRSSTWPAIGSDGIGVRRYNGAANSNDHPHAIAVDLDGNVFVTGMSSIPFNTEYRTIGYDQSGNVIFSAAYDGPGNLGDEAYDISVKGGFVYVTGSSGTGVGSSDIVTVKYDYNGNLSGTWPIISSVQPEMGVRRYNGVGPGSDRGNALTVDASGNVYVTGSTNVSTAYSDYVTIKYSPSGDVNWVSTYDYQPYQPFSNDEAKSIVVDGFGDVYVTGSSNKAGTLPIIDYATIKYRGTDGALSLDWPPIPGNPVAGVRRYAGDIYDGGATSIGLDGSGNVYVTGGNRGDFATIKYDPTGTPSSTWPAGAGQLEVGVRRYHKPGNSRLIASAQVVDCHGNVYVTGSPEINTGISVVTIKYDEYGIQQWLKDEYVGAMDNMARAIAIDGRGNVYVAGSHFMSNTTHWDYTIIKYSQGIAYPVFMFSYTNLSNTTSLSNRNFSDVIIASTNGINGAPGFRPRVYYKRHSEANQFVGNNCPFNGWKYVEANGSTSPFDFTIDYSLLRLPVDTGCGVSCEEQIDYFVVAQDLACTPNVLVRSGTFASHPESVDLTGAAFPIGGVINSYSITCDYINNDVDTLRAIHVVPPTPSTGTGVFTGSYDTATKSLSFTLNFNGLGGVTTSAHIHAPAGITTNGPVSIPFSGFPTGVSSGSYSNSFTLTPQQEMWFLADSMYVDIHTTSYPGGEIRAQLIPTTPFGLNCSVVSGQPYGTADLTITYGNPPYNIVWSNGATTSHLENLAPGMYSVKVTDASFNSCSSSIVIPPRPTKIVGPISGIINGIAMNATLNIDLNHYTWFSTAKLYPIPASLGYTLMQCISLATIGGPPVACETGGAINFISTGATNITRETKLTNFSGDTLFVNYTTNNPGGDTIYLTGTVNGTVPSLPSGSQVIYEGWTDVWNQADSIEIDMYGLRRYSVISGGGPPNPGGGGHNSRVFSNGGAYLHPLPFSEVRMVTSPTANYDPNSQTLTFTEFNKVMPFSGSVLELTSYIQGFYRADSNLMRPDTVRAFLRREISPYNLIDSSKSILSPTGTGTFMFANALNKENYYIQLKHRNSIETWSSTPQFFSNAILAYNFTLSSAQAFGNNLKQVDTSPVRFAIYGGDVNQNGAVDLLDASIVDNDSYNFVTGYVNSDVTGDGITDLLDALVIDNNSFNFVSVIKP